MIYRQTLIVDASFNHDSNATGIGIAIHETDKVVKNRNGVLIDQISEAYVGICPGYGEMLALFRALEISKERGYSWVRLRSDYNILRKKLKNSYEENSDFDRLGLYGETMRITRFFDRVQFGYKPKRKNQMAHNLARIGAKDTMPIRDERLIRICSESDAKLTRRCTRQFIS